MRRRLRRCGRSGKPAEVGRKRIEVRVELDEDEAREFMDLIQDSRAVLDELLKEVRSLKRKVREVEVAVKDAAK